MANSSLLRAEQRIQQQQIALDDLARELASEREIVACLSLEKRSSLRNAGIPGDMDKDGLMSSALRLQEQGPGHRLSEGCAPTAGGGVGAFDVWRLREGLEQVLQEVGEVLVGLGGEVDCCREVCVDLESEKEALLDEARAGEEARRVLLAELQDVERTRIKTQDSLRVLEEQRADWLRERESMELESERDRVGAAREREALAGQVAELRGEMRRMQEEAEGEREMIAAEVWRESESARSALEEDRRRIKESLEERDRERRELREQLKLAQARVSDMQAAETDRVRAEKQRQDKRLVEENLRGVIQMQLDAREEEGRRERDALKQQLDEAQHRLQLAAVQDSERAKEDLDHAAERAMFNQKSREWEIQRADLQQQVNMCREKIVGHEAALAQAEEALVQADEASTRSEAEIAALNRRLDECCAKLVIADENVWKSVEVTDELRQELDAANAQLREALERERALAEGQARERKQMETDVEAAVHLREMLKDELAADLRKVSCFGPRQSQVS
jgi:hypothetical protein